jgi:hypothetical protein
MRRIVMKNLLILLTLLFLSNLAFSQKITKVINQYVLINTDQGIGKIGDIIVVNRKINNITKKVGRISIIKFKNGMTACKIIEGNIKIGDFIKSDEDHIVNDLFASENKYSKNNYIQESKSEIGFNCGAFFPMGDMSDAYLTSFVLSLFISFPISPSSNAIFEISYPFLNIKSELKNIVESYGIKYNASLLMVNVYDRYRINASTYIDIGAGIYFPKFSATGYGTTASISKTGFGVCLGPTFLLNNSTTSRIYLITKYHTYNIENNWVKFIKADLQIAFNLSR